MRVVVVCGPPGSGKTTLAREMAMRQRSVLFSYDDFPGANQRESIMAKWIDSIVFKVADGKDVVCDGLFLTRSDRMAFLDSFAGIECQKDLIFLCPPLHVCLERNRKRTARLPDFVVVQAHRKFEAPDADEGWASIEKG